MKSFLRSLLAFYGTSLPYHRGKWRIVDGLYQKLELKEEDPKALRPFRRRNVDWLLRDDCTIQRAVRYLGVYEREETRFLEALWKPGMTVFDVGANFGYYSLLAANTIGDSGKVFSFEPYPPNRTQLNRILQRNGMDQVDVFDFALSDSAGSVSFVVPPDSCLGVGRIAVEPNVKGERVEVETLTLDHFAAQQKLERLDFMKLDVEGAETRVVRGGRETLKTFQPTMLVEINPEGLTEFGSSPEELVGLLQELGYGLFRVRGGKLQRLPTGEGVDYVEMFGDHGNTIAVPEAQNG